MVYRQRGCVGQRVARLQACHRRLQPVRLHRLQQVVDRAALEGVDRVLVIGGDEHDLRARAGVGGQRGDFQAGQAGHADVEEGDVRGVFGQRFHRAGAVLAFGDDLQRRPRALEFGHQCMPQQGFVLGDDAGADRIGFAQVRHGWRPVAAGSREP